MKNYKVKLEMSTHDLCIFRCAIAKQLKHIWAEYQILLITKDRDLTQPERWQLPANIQQLSREELQEQIDPWYSLYSQTKYWSDELEKMNIQEITVEQAADSLWEASKDKTYIVTVGISDNRLILYVNNLKKAKSFKDYSWEGFPVEVKLMKNPKPA